jgi:hypothetical protein
MLVGGVGGAPVTGCKDRAFDWLADSLVREKMRRKEEEEVANAQKW